MPDQTMGPVAQAAYNTTSASTPLPSPIEPERIYNIEIRQVDRGYIVNIGCKTLVFGSASELIMYLNMYLLNPGNTQKQFFEGKLFV